MAIHNWVLTDTDRNLYEQEFAVDGAHVGRDFKGAVKKRTLRGGKQDGVDVIEVNNGRFDFTVIPTRGMNVWRGRLGAKTLGWRSPVQGPVHPRFVPLMEPSGLGWLDGFDELLVRCGLESNGAPEFDENHNLKYPLHGRIGNTPAKRVEVSIDDASGVISVTGVVEESRFHFQKLRLTSTISTSPNQQGFEIRDVVENFGGTPTDMQILYHVNFGQPLLDSGSKLVAPIDTLVPRNEHAAGDVENWNTYAPPKAGFEEQVYFSRLAADDDGHAQVLLHNKKADEGVSLHFNTRQLPCFTQWKNTPAEADGYVTGLEPGTNYPNPRSHEAHHDRVVTLPPGGKATFDLALAWHTDADAVTGAARAIAELQSSVEPTIHDEPQPGWCAD